MIAPEQTAQHLVAKVWAALSGDGCRARAIETLKATKKGEVYRLLRAGPNGSAIVAKRCRRETGEVERLFYEKVLPKLPLPILTYHGFVPDEEESLVWLCLEDADGIAYSSEDREHRVLAAHWLAALHSLTLEEDVVEQLPPRRPSFYLGELHAACERIKANLGNPALTTEDRVLLRKLLEQCERVTAIWPRIDAICDGMPAGLVHGDFVAKNLRVRRSPTLELRVFDWEVAGWGVLAADLAHCPDPTAYARAMRMAGHPLQLRDVLRLADCGRIFRLITSISWASWYLAYEWVEKGLRRLRCYEIELPLHLRTLTGGN